MKLDKNALEEAKNTLCYDAFRIFEAAYIVNESEFKFLPEFGEQRLDTSGLTIISLEGMNCSGKSTQVRRLTERLKDYQPFNPPRFYDCVPQRIISSMSSGNFYQMMNPIVDSLLIASACIDKYDQVIREGHEFVLTDRSMDSLYAFQGRKVADLGHSLEDSLRWLMGIVKCVDDDDQRFYLDISLNEAARRSQRREEITKRVSLTDRDLKELAENKTIYDFLRNNFDREYIDIDAERNEEEITEMILSKIDTIKLRRKK